MAIKLEVQIDGNKIYSPIRDKWLVLTPEEQVRQDYICCLVNSYGYSLEQMAEELSVTQTSRGNGRARADIVVWKSKQDKINNDEAFIVVECKAEHVKIHQSDYFQGQNYARWVGAKFFITTNQKETKFFEVPKRFPNILNEIVEIPTAREALDDKKVKEISNRTKKFERDEFSKLLLKCHNIIRNNDKLSPEAAFDEISKILFMKIRYERQQKEGIVFSLDRFKESEEFYNENVRPTLMNPEEQKLSYMQREFIKTKQEFEDDKLFEPHETIKIKQYSFEQILKELEKYNLSATDDDVKGIAFEEFLGTTFRGELGQFFTPRTIVDFMVEVLDPQEGETICDPTCGSGGFLIKAFEYIREKIENDIQKEKDHIKNILFDEKFIKASEAEKEKINELVNSYNHKLNTEILVPNKKFKEQSDSEKSRRISKLSSSCIYGTDANPRMARTSKMNMIMHGDGHGGVHHHDGLINVNGIFEDRFDVILTNPPFGSRIEKDYKLSETDKDIDIILDLSKEDEKYIEAEINKIKDIKSKERLKQYYKRYGIDYLKRLNELNKDIELQKTILSRFDLGKTSSLTEVLFMERCLKLLKPGGRMGIVLPEGVLNNSNLQKVRDYFESEAKILLITSIPPDVFTAAGATIKPSLLFFKRFTEKERKQYTDAKNIATKTVDKEFEPQIKEIEAKYADDKKAKTKALKDIEAEKEAEIKEKTKELFNYEIPIAQVEKAGITTTGAKCKNELEDVALEFKNYRDLKGLWAVNKPDISYKINGEKLTRITNGVKEVIDE